MTRPTQTPTLSKDACASQHFWYKMWYGRTRGWSRSVTAIHHATHFSTGNTVSHTMHFQLHTSSFTLPLWTTELQGGMQLSGSLEPLKNKNKNRKNKISVSISGWASQRVAVEKFACWPLTKPHHEFHVHTHQNNSRHWDISKSWSLMANGKGRCTHSVLEVRNAQTTWHYSNCVLTDPELGAFSRKQASSSSHTALTVISRMKQTTGQKACRGFCWFRALSTQDKLLLSLLEKGIFLMFHFSCKNTFKNSKSPY